MIVNEKYTFRKQILICEQILNMLDKDSLRFVGHTYGSNSRWDIGLKSMFIYQMLSGFQVPELMFDGSEKNWYVITGERQLKCIYEYITGSLTLSEEALGEFKKYKRFEELPLMLKRKLLNTEFFVTVLNPGVTQSNRYRIYEMGSVTEGSSDLWAVAKFVFPDGYNNLERIVDDIILSYPNIKQNRRQIVRLPLLWKIRNDEYTIGMITLYEENSEKKDSKPIVHILDGQQRMISLAIISKALGKSKDFVRLTFERDKENKEREKFLYSSSSEQVKSNNEKSVDVQHMKTACEFLQEKCLKKNEKKWSGEEKNDYFDWMMRNVMIICRYTENEPLQEFLCLNEKKTPFSSTDYDRAYQLKYWSNQEITQEMVLKEHAEIQRYLYTNDKLYDLVKYRYPGFLNHMDVIFQKLLEDKYDKAEGTTGQHKGYKDAFFYLQLCHVVLRSIYQELEEQGNASMNVNVYNAVMTLYQLDKNFKFFDLVDINSNETFEIQLRNRFNLLGKTYNYMKQKEYQNEFLQSQLYGKIIVENGNIDNAVLKDAYKEEKQYISPGIYNIVSEKIKVTEE